MSKFRSLTAGLAEGFRAARYLQALSGMTDRQLAELGLNRDGIRARALELARLR